MHATPSTEPPPRDTYTARGLRYARAYDARCLHRVRASRDLTTVLEVLETQVGRFAGRAREGVGDDGVDPRWTRALELDRVRVRESASGAWTRAGLDARVRTGMVIETTRHVHERATAAATPRVVFERDDGTGILGVEKPGGVPVLAGVSAPGVSGRLNCVALVSARRRREVAARRATTDETTSKRARVDDGADDGRVWAVNRLDAPVSGVWLCATSVKASLKAREWLSKPGTSTKTYLARVSKGSALTTPDGGLRIDAPLWKNAKTSVAELRPESEGGKPCATRIFLLERFEDDDTALVVARLESNGRYHQIRAHLGSIGHPIANDATYNDDVSADDETVFAGRAYDDDESGTIAAALAADRDPTCPECDALIALTASKDRSRKPLAAKIIWLHSLRYQFVVRDVAFDIRSDSIPAFARRPPDLSVYDLIAQLPDAS